MGRGIRSGNEWGWERVSEWVNEWMREQRTGIRAFQSKSDCSFKLLRDFTSSLPIFYPPQFLSPSNPEAHRSESSLHQKFFSFFPWFISTFLYHHQLFKDRRKVSNEKGRRTKWLNLVSFFYSYHFPSFRSFMPVTVTVVSTTFLSSVRSFHSLNY